MCIKSIIENKNSRVWFDPVGSGLYFHIRQHSINVHICFLLEFIITQLHQDARYTVYFIHMPFNKTHCIWQISADISSYKINTMQCVLMFVIMFTNDYNDSGLLMHSQKDNHRCVRCYAIHVGVLLHPQTNATTTSMLVRLLSRNIST